MNRATTGIRYYPLVGIREAIKPDCDCINRIPRLVYRENPVLTVVRSGPDVLLVLELSRRDTQLLLHDIGVRGGDGNRVLELAGGVVEPETGHILGFHFLDGEWDGEVDISVVNGSHRTTIKDIPITMLGGTRVAVNRIRTARFRSATACETDKRETGSAGEDLSARDHTEGIPPDGINYSAGILQMRLFIR